MSKSLVSVSTGPLVRFLLGHGLAALAVGIHLVMLSWLSVGVLHLDAASVGWVQVAALVPSLASIAYAGVLADRVNPVFLMVCVQAVLGLTFTAFALVLWFDSLTFLFLLLYGGVVGACNGLIQPLREKLLMQMDVAILQRKISSASAVQFTCQGSGVLLVTLTAYFELSMLFVVQAAVSILAATLYASLVKYYSSVQAASESSLESDLDRGESPAKGGPVESWRAPVALMKKLSGLRQILILAAFNGYMHLGVFVVALPLLARDGYGLGSQAYALLQFTFMVGMILANVRLLSIERVRFPGQGALFSLLYTAVIGIAMSRGPTVTGLYLLVGAWGWVAGNSAGLSRMVLQSLVSFELKGRVMAMYQLVLFGMAPLGALATGYALHVFPLGVVFIVMSVSSAVLFVAFLFSRALWGVEQVD